MMLYTTPLHCNHSLHIVHVDKVGQFSPSPCTEVLGNKRVKVRERTIH